MYCAGFNIPHTAPEQVLLMALESSIEKKAVLFLGVLAMYQFLYFL